MATYLLPKARRTLTGQTVKTQDLTGARYTLRQRAFAEQAAEQLALKMQDQTNDEWTPIVVEYTPSVRRSEQD